MSTKMMTMKMKAHLHNAPSPNCMHVKAAYIHSCFMVSVLHGMVAAII